MRSEVLLHTLEDRGICVSAGSACASNHPAISGVLQAIGTPREYLDSTLRFSLSEFTTKEEIDYTLKHYIIVFRCFGNIHGADFMTERYGAKKEKKMEFYSFLIKYGEIGIKGKNRYI